jgi:excisionase family DNA binding protein
MSILKKLREREEPLNTSELARLLVVTEATILRWIRNRQIPAIRIGDVIRFDGAMLAAWFEMQAACTLPPSAPRNPEDYLHWQDLGKLVQKDVPSSGGKS